ncbi:hypothetical protein [Mycobacterium helveticum]|uniref:Uncharacterized protein n=1 Tax=Mycobacterium helveticum TaxID=2592811 RepID=A0A557WXE9_9MYCO|nr:hypothetical protein [Mycobacterium helveticum]TVS77294.1 hypothetical protein FPZ46_26120 [Mycobacterium helveticum]TVS77956.1 hypothetical protein FPZ47_25890 [Mycobacterium helveticum]
MGSYVDAEFLCPKRIGVAVCRRAAFSAANAALTSVADRVAQAHFSPPLTSKPVTANEYRQASTGDARDVGSFSSSHPANFFLGTCHIHPIHPDVLTTSLMW